MAVACCIGKVVKSNSTWPLLLMLPSVTAVFSEALERFSGTQSWNMPWAKNRRWLS